MKNYGLLETLREVGEYIAGASTVPWVPFNESGDWEEYLPKYENQTTKLGHETSGCTVHGSQNQAETMLRFLYGGQPNFSERYTYNLVPINPDKGANPHVTHETIRKHGLIDERYLPMTDSIDEYLDRTAITKSLLAKGQYWLSLHDYKHEWLWEKRPENWKELLKEALTTSPIAVSVTAWREVDGYYVSDNGGNNHYCLLYKIDDDGAMWVFDSYDHSKKRLHPDHNIRRAKRIFINRRTRVGSQSMIRILKDVIERLTMKPTLLSIAQEHLGKEVTPKDEVPDEVACASVVTTLMKKYNPNVPHITGTWSLMVYLNDHAKRVEQPVPGCIVISPTGTGTGIGHVGIMTDDNKIASNNSFGIYKGLFTENFTLSTWFARYGTKQKMKVLFYIYE